MNWNVTPLLLKPHPRAQAAALKVHVSLCVHRAMDVEAVESLFQLAHSQNPKVTWSTHKGDALIDRARSMEASHFLKRGTSDVLLFLDDDIGYDPFDVLRVCRLAMEKKSIAGATYIVKAEKNPYITAKPFPGQVINFAPDAEPVEVRMLATGCMAISWDVIRAMSKNLPLCHELTMPFYPFFQPYAKQIDGQWMYLGEDWAFCERAKEHGFKLWLDPSVRLRHSGTYSYTLDDLVREPKKEVLRINYSEQPPDLK